MTVGDDFPREQARCRELLKAYVGSEDPNNYLGAAIAKIKAVLARADQAMASGNTIWILASYEEMRGCE